MNELALDRSYRALLAVPSIGRVLLSMQVARIAQTMVGTAIVLFTLFEYQSAPLAGLVTFLGIFPGLLVSPIAGALLDRHGRIRLIVLDYLIALASLGLIGVLSLADLLPAWLLLLIAGVSSLTAPLSATGLRSLFPIIVPSHLWERVNAVDSNGYLVATILGPPLAAVSVSLLGGATTLILIALMFGLAAIVIVGAPDPRTDTNSTGRLLVDAWLGLVYTWRNRTLRGLGFSISVLNLAAGMAAIVIPLLVLDRLGLDAATVGFVFAVQGVTGVVAGFVSGRVDTRGRERVMLVVPMVGAAFAVALLLPSAGLGLVILSSALIGLLNGPLDVALFTLRQRRTDPAWMGRAFAVSMSFNFMGFPIGAALAGWLAVVSIDAAIVLAIGACLVAALLAAVMIPQADPDVERSDRASSVGGRGADDLPGRA